MIEGIIRFLYKLSRKLDRPVRAICPRCGNPMVRYPFDGTIQVRDTMYSNIESWFCPNIDNLTARFHPYNVDLGVMEKAVETVKKSVSKIKTKVSRRRKHK